MPSPLTRFQRLLLRAWAITMTFAFRLGDSRFMGLNYTPADCGYSSEEETRLRALAAPLSATAVAVSIVLSVAFFSLVGAPVLIFVLPRLPALPSIVILGLIIVTAFSILPFVLAAAAGAVELLFQIPPFEESALDAELLGKVRVQLLLVEIVTIVGAIIAEYVPSMWR